MIGNVVQHAGLLLKAMNILSKAVPNVLFSTKPGAQYVKRKKKKTKIEDIFKEDTIWITALFGGKYKGEKNVKTKKLDTTEKDKGKFIYI